MEVCAGRKIDRTLMRNRLIFPLPPVSLLPKSPIHYRNYLFQLWQQIHVLYVVIEDGGHLPSF